MDSSFHFDGTRYVVNREAAEQLGFIRLPDRTLLQVLTWTMTSPPSPGVRRAMVDANQPAAKARIGKDRKRS